LVSPDLMKGALKEISANRAMEGRHVQECREIIFGVYNRKVAGHTQLFPIFHSFETAFRSTVSVQLEQYYRQPKWWEDVYQALRQGRKATTVTQIGKHRLPKDTAHLIGEVIVYLDGSDPKRNIVRTLTDGYAITEQCKLSHIERLIVEHWSLFETKFKRGTKKLTCKDFRYKFSRIRNARNKVYHHQSFSRMTQIVHTAEELLDYLNFSLKFVYQKVTSSSVPAPRFTLSIEPRHHTW
jgi:hypothetical protein